MHRVIRDRFRWESANSFQEIRLHAKILFVAQLEFYT